MFGYVKIRRDELRLKEYRFYKSYYCGLCNVLKSEYGIKSRFLLNYDCAFLAVAVALAFNTETELKKKRCPYKAISRREYFAMPNEALRFAAAMNVLLAYYSFEDGWIDDKNVFKGISLLTFKKAAKKAGMRYPMLKESIQTNLSALREYEKSNEKDIDLPANASAKILSDSVYLFAKGKNNCNALTALCFAIGRWIYIIDAWNDKEKDRKKDSFNPFLISPKSDEQVKNMLYMCLSYAQEAFSLLEPATKTELSEILKNVLCYGCVDEIERTVKS